MEVVKTKKLLVSLVVCGFATSLSFGSVPAVPGSQLTSDATGARASSGKKIAINYAMRSLRFITTIKPGDDDKLKTESNIESLKQGVSFSFLKGNGEDDIFYVSNVKLLRGDCSWRIDVDGKNLLDGVKKDCSGLTFELSTYAGILLSLNQEKTIKMGAYGRRLFSCR